MQVINEVSVAGYLNTIQVAIDRGMGNGFDVKASYAAEIPLAGDPAALVQRMDLLLLNDRMSPALRARLVAAVSSVAVPAAGASQASIDTANLNRVKLAVFLTMASPEYLVQR
jgi:hypothetical protein